MRLFCNDCYIDGKIVEFDYDVCQNCGGGGVISEKDIIEDITKGAIKFGNLAIQAEKLDLDGDLVADDIRQEFDIMDHELGW